jgi:origin recognition complex subunit 1
MATRPLSLSVLKALRRTDCPPPQFLGEGTLAVDGNTYYSRVLVEGAEVSVGDSVLMVTDEAEFTYTGKVLLMFATPDGRPVARVNWYQRREEVDPAQRPLLLARELLLTDATDECPVDAIVKPCTIFSDPSFIGPAVHQPARLVTDAFFCNRGYLVKRGELIALSTLNRLMKSTEYGIEKVSGATKFDMARACLQLNFVTAVAGREREMDTLDRFLHNFISKDGQGGCIYISGVPGTGKTLVVREVMRRLAVRELAGETKPFQFYELNCLRLETPREIYSELWHLLTDEKVNPVTAQRALNEMFHREKSPFSIVVLVDEIDVMLTPQQNELYCLLEWSSLPEAKFIVIAVANLMELQSRLKPKIQSRMGKTAVKFTAYNKDQLMAIIKSRVGDLEVFSNEAIEQCAKAVSNNGGDARKALESCKRALDLHKDPVKLVSMMEMHTALRQISSIQAHSILGQLSKYQAVFLCALLVHIKMDKRTLIAVRDVAERTMGLAKALRLEAFSIHQVVQVVNELILLNVLKSHRDGPASAASQISLVAFDEDLLAILSKLDYLANHLPKRLE